MIDIVLMYLIKLLAAQSLIKKSKFNYFKDHLHHCVKDACIMIMEMKK